jgi:hypothetical protein
MRLVTRFVFQQDFFGDKTFEKAYRTFVADTAQSAWCSRIKEHGQIKEVIAPNWNPKVHPCKEDDYPTTGELWPQVLQTNGLDALNAAVYIGEG